MKTNVYRFRFAPGIDLTQAEATLHLAILACEGLFGEARVRMGVSFHIDAPRAMFTLDGGTSAGDAVVRIFAAFLIREIGADGFSVRAVAAPVPQSIAVGAA